MALKFVRNIAAASPAETFRHIRDFLIASNGIADYSATGVGYTVVDSSYAGGNSSAPAPGDWCVLASNGEADSYPLYYRLEFGTTNRHRIKIYLGWNATTHTGIGEAYSGDNIEHGGAASTISIHADLDEIHIIINPSASANTFWHPFFRLTSTTYSGDALPVAAAIAAGSNVDITLPSWPPWAEAGKIIYNWDGTGMHLLTITAIDQAGLTITVATSYAKSAGSWLAEDLCYGVPKDGWSSITSVCCVPQRSGSLTDTTYAIVYPAIASLGPDSKYGHRFVADLFVATAGELHGKFKLARETSAPSAQGAAWVDIATGQAYRIYTAYSGKHTAIMEAT